MPYLCCILSGKHEQEIRNGVKYPMLKFNPLCNVAHGNLSNEISKKLERVNELFSLLLTLHLEFCIVVWD